MSRQPRHNPCRHSHRLVPWILLISIGLVVPATAVAQEEPAAEAEADQEEEEQEEEGEEEEEDQAEKHFRAGSKLYKDGKYQEAIEELLKAYELRPAPPILLNIARTYGKLDQKENALKYYKEFLQKARLMDPMRPRIEALVKKLQRQVKVKTGAVTSDEGTETPAADTPGEEDGVPLLTRKEQMIHTPVDSAKVHEPITVMAELPPRVAADRVILYVRKGGETDFRMLPMELQGEAYIARIPARLVTSTSLQYYIQAHKGKGKRSVVAEAGTKRTPNIVVIAGGRAPTLAWEKPTEIRSPYRTWIWVSGAAAVAFLGGSLAFELLALDRKSAMERWVDEKSCDEACKKGVVPKLGFDIKARDWEKEGKTFALASQIMLGLGIAAAGATGYLWYMDHRYVKRERARLADSTAPPRVVASPWMTPGGAGLVGQLSF